MSCTSVSLQCLCVPMINFIWLLFCDLHVTPFHLSLPLPHLCVLSAVADLQRMFPTPPSLEQHPAFSPIMTYRDTLSQEPPIPSGAADHLLPLASAQLPEYKMETEEGVASPRQEDIKVRGSSSWSAKTSHTAKTGSHFLSSWSDSRNMLELFHSYLLLTNWPSLCRESDICTDYRLCELRTVN